MKPMTTRLFALALGLPLVACDADTPERRHATVVTGWTDTSPDAVLLFAVETPPAVDRLLARLELCPTFGNFGEAAITKVELGGAALELGPPGTFHGPQCRTLSALPPSALAGATLRVTMDEAEAPPRTFEVTAPAFPAPPESAVFTLDALRRGPTTWLATPHDGLIGLTDAGMVHYPGVATSAPWDPTARGPQSGLVLTLAPAGERALWVSTATTGVSWFDPGAAPLSVGDDTWLHGQPTAEPSLAAELAQTGIDLAPDPLDPDRVWVASLNGLYRVTRTAEALVFERVADGPALAVAVGPDGRVWAGFSTQVVVNAPMEGGDGADTTVTLPAAEGALLTFGPGDEAHPRWALAEEDAATALLADADGVWVGTPYGLGRVALGEALTLAPAAGLALDPDAAVVDLEPTATGFWLAARGECEVGSGALIEVTTEGDAITATADKSDHGFGERDFTRVRALPSGEVLVTTLVPSLDGLTGDTPDTARGCLTPKPAERTADTYLLPLTGPARRLP